MNLKNKIMFINSLFSINQLPIFLFFDDEDEMLFLASKDARYEIDSLYHNNDDKTQKWLDSHNRLIPLYKQIYEAYPNGYVHPSIIDNNIVILPREDQGYITIKPYDKTVDIEFDDKVHKNINWSDLKDQLETLS
jgi:hypothetical protein|nr:MAG TPA: hypothetical protein [Caudoviricetes sp.]